VITTVSGSRYADSGPKAWLSGNLHTLLHLRGLGINTSLYYFQLTISVTAYRFQPDKSTGFSHRGTDNHNGTNEGFQLESLLFPKEAHLTMRLFEWDSCHIITNSIIIYSSIYATVFLFSAAATATMSMSVSGLGRFVTAFSLTSATAALAVAVFATMFMISLALAAASAIAMLMMVVTVVLIVIAVAAATLVFMFRVCVHHIPF
jgi:hypothetical protein